MFDSFNSMSIPSARRKREARAPSLRTASHRQPSEARLPTTDRKLWSFGTHLILKHTSKPFSFSEKRILLFSPILFVVLVPFRFENISLFRILNKQMQVCRHQLLQHFFALHFASHNFWYSGVEYMYFVNHYKQHSEGRCSCQSHTRPWLHPAQEAFAQWTRVHDKRFVQSCLAIITGILYVELYWLACKQAKKLQDCPHLPQQKPFLLQLFVCIQQFFFVFQNTCLQYTENKKMV